MKKLFSLIVILVTLSSCQEEVKFNNDPGFQAFRDNVIFKGIDVRAYKTASGALRIVALAEGEEVVLKTTSTNIGMYPLGTSVSKSATYTNSFDGNEVFYTTGIDIGNGLIEITENANNTVSGNFKFNAENISDNPLGNELVNFQYGAFYQLPLIPEP
jgi:hypothetical protein